MKNLFLFVLASLFALSLTAQGVVNTSMIRTVDADPNTLAGFDDQSGDFESVLVYDQTADVWYDFNASRTGNKWLPLVDHECLFVPETRINAEQEQVLPLLSNVTGSYQSTLPSGNDIDWDWDVGGQVGTETYGLGFVTGADGGAYYLEASAGINFQICFTADFDTPGQLIEAGEGWEMADGLLLDVSDPDGDFTVIAGSQIMANRLIDHNNPSQAQLCTTINSDQAIEWEFAGEYSVKLKFVVKGAEFGNCEQLFLSSCDELLYKKSVDGNGVSTFAPVTDQNAYGGFCLGDYYALNNTPTGPAGQGAILYEDANGNIAHRQFDPKSIPFAANNNELFQDNSNFAYDFPYNALRLGNTTSIPNLPALTSHKGMTMTNQTGTSVMEINTFRTFTGNGSKVTLNRTWGVSDLSWPAALATPKDYRTQNNENTQAGRLMGQYQFGYRSPTGTWLLDGTEIAGYIRAYDDATGTVSTGIGLIVSQGNVETLNGATFNDGEGAYFRSGGWNWTNYPNTRDDSGANTPLNFLYTNGSGEVLSAPISLIGDGGGGGGSVPIFVEGAVAFGDSDGTLTFDENTLFWDNTIKGFSVGPRNGATFFRAGGFEVTNKQNWYDVGGARKAAEISVIAADQSGPAGINDDSVTFASIEAASIHNNAPTGNGTAMKLMTFPYDYTGTFYPDFAGTSMLSFNGAAYLKQASNAREFFVNWGNDHDLTFVQGANLTRRRFTIENSGHIIMQAYGSARDNSDTDTPVNFLYTTASGGLRSAPVSTITGTERTFMASGISNDQTTASGSNFQDWGNRSSGSGISSYESDVSGWRTSGTEFTVPVGFDGIYEITYSISHPSTNLGGIALQADVGLFEALMTIDGTEILGAGSISGDTTGSSLTIALDLAAGQTLRFGYVASVAAASQDYIMSLLIKPITGL